MSRLKLGWSSVTGRRVITAGIVLNLQSISNFSQGIVKIS
jgi:hypothetical protein